MGFMSMRITLLLIACGFCINMDLVAGVINECQEVRQTKIESREFIQPGDKYLEIKNSVTQQALIDAVKQTLGTDIRSNYKLQSTQVNDDFSDKSNEMNIEKARGYVKSYEVIKEDVETKGNLNLLVIEIIANVCVPDETGIQEVVVIGDVLDIDGKPDPDLKSILASSFPQGENFIIRTGDVNDDYHDILITGKLISTTTDVTGNTTKSAMELFGKFLDKNLAKGMKDKVKKVTVIASVNAADMSDNQSISETVEVSASIDVKSKESTVLPGLIKQALGKAAKELHKQMLEGERKIEKKSNPLRSLFEF